MMYLGNQAVGIATSLPEFADIAKIECGNYTPTEDENPNNIYIPHSLGEIPDFIVYQSTGVAVSDSYQYTYLISGIIYIVPVLNYPEFPSDSFYQSIFARKQQKGIAYSNILVNMSNFATTSNFLFPRAQATDRLKANVTYHYVIGKFKEVTPNA